LYCFIIVILITTSILKLTLILSLILILPHIGCL
jgi:hypothetical protein